MATLLILSGAASLLALLLYTIRIGINYARYVRKRESLGCPPLPHYPHWDPVLGLDFVYAMFRALWQHRFLEFQKESYTARGSKVWSATFLGNRMIYSSDPDNMKAMSTSHQDAFGVEPIRMANDAVTPFTGRGVNTSDGEKWQASRNIVKPYFDRSGYTNLERLGEHTDRLLSKIPTDGSTVDMQPLFQRWFLDTSTDFLFGETVNSLDHPERDWPLRDMITIMRGLRLRLQLSSFMFLHRDKEWFAAVDRMHTFLYGYIDKAMEQWNKEKSQGNGGGGSTAEERNDFLWTVVRQVPDRLEIRTQLIGVWFPSNETTSILMSNVIFALSRDPRVVDKLRSEVIAYGDKPITFEGLRSIAYLRYVINETHRLYPISLQTVRSCLKDTTLPSGGGPKGTSPIFCQKGDIVHCNRYLMHRDPDLWGDDTEHFIPERWSSARPMWNFVPFGGGPRICPAHVMVDTECSFMVFRLLQQFQRIESRDSEPYTAVMRAGPANKNGVKVAFVPA